MVYYFGTDCNPWTRQHQDILHEFCESHRSVWKEDDVIVIAINSLKDETGIKGHSLCSSEEYRMELVQSAIDHLCERHPFLKDDNHQSIYIDFQCDKGIDKFCEDFCAQNNLKLEYADIKTLELNFNPSERISYVDDVVAPKVRDIFYRNPCVSFDEVKDYLYKETFDCIKSWHHYHQIGHEDEYRQGETIAASEYDTNKRERPSVVADVLIIREEQKVHYDEVIPVEHPENSDILLVRRKDYPYKGFWSLPGGFFDVKEDINLEDTVGRILGDSLCIMESVSRNNQFRTFSDEGIDSKLRIIEAVYVLKDSRWYPKAGDGITEFGWFKMNELPRMAFNHRQIIEEYRKHVSPRKTPEGLHDMGPYFVCDPAPSDMNDDPEDDDLDDED